MLTHWHLNRPSNRPNRAIGSRENSFPPTSRTKQNFVPKLPLLLGDTKPAGEKKTAITIADARFENRTMSEKTKLNSEHYPKVLIVTDGRTYTLDSIVSTTSQKSVDKKMNKYI